MNRLDNKVCIITGAANGMGLETMKLFLAEGAKVVACDFAKDDLAESVKSMDAEGRVLAFHMDVRDEAAWKECVKLTLDTYGRIDVLINNAGGGRQQGLEESSVDDFDFIIDLNLKGNWLGMREVIPVMKEQGGGSIVNCGSVSSQLGGDTLSAVYCAAKGGLAAMTKNTADVYGKYGIRANMVHPGPTFTSTVLKAYPGLTVEYMGYTFKDCIPLPPHAAEPIDITNAYLFFASDESKFVTGQQVCVDGGWTAGGGWPTVG